MAGFSFLQSFSQNAAPSGATTTFTPIVTTAGSYLICCIQYDQIGATLAISDNVNGNWTKIVANDSLIGEQFEIWHLPVNAGGTITIKQTGGNGTSNTQFVFGEYSQQLTSGPLDSNTTLTEQANPTASYGPLTTHVNGDALIWIGFTGANVAWTPSTGFNSRLNGNNAIGAVLFDSESVAAVAGSYPFSATASSSDLFGALIAVKSALAATPTFNPAAGTYNGTQTVTISSSTPGGTVYYTTDGSTPTHASSSIANGGTISVASSETVKAILGEAGFGDSATGNAAYIITHTSSGGQTGLQLSMDASLRNSGLRH